MKKVLICSALLLAGVSFAADAGLTGLNDAAAWKKAAMTAGKDGAAMEVVRPGMLEFPQAVKIDPAKKYRFSGEVRKSPDAPTGMFLAGYVLYDKDNKQIMTQHIRAIAGTMTELAAAANAGDTTVKIKNGARWNTKGAHYVAFNAGTYPNRDLSEQIKNVQRTGNVWTVTLTKPLKKAYKAGTKVQIQASGAHFSPVNIAKPDGTWKKFSFDIQGVDTVVQRNSTKFWPGAVSFKPMIMPNWNWASPDKNKMKTQFRNFKVEIVD
ncbi:MAG: hypothetical protein IKB25_05960 [Lentisphaeria bacterium]|nr:hypothetical protein [Lentisphaeria bacterium]